MSFEVYLQAFHNRQESGFAPERVRELLGEHLTEVEPDFWQIRFSSSESSDLFLSPANTEALQIHSISVHRPCNDSRLWEALFALLEVPGSIFYFPGCLAPLTRDPAAADSLPTELLEDLGQPQVAENPLHLLRAVQSA